MSRTLGLVLSLLLVVGAPARAQDPPGDDDPERARVREGLARQRAWAEAGRRIAQLDQELTQATDWVQKAILCIELADAEDRRAVAPLARALGDAHAMVKAFALHGLARSTPEDLRKGGGAPLATALVEVLKVKAHYHRRVARSLLAALAGEDLGPDAGRWRAWLRKAADGLPVEPPPPPFDASGFDPATVAKVDAEVAAGGTSVRPRIPPVASTLRELRRGGIDVGICLDQTSSMGAVISEAKARIELLTHMLALVVEDRRLGLVTYDDHLKVFEPLTADMGRLRATLDKVQAVGGGDIPEGVDKGLEATCRPDFGWRKASAKAVIIIGDAPPHEPDVAMTLDLAATMRERLGIVTHAVSTGGTAVPELAQIAERGGGRSLLLREPARLVSEVLLLIFGEGLRPAMERFVPVLMEINEEERAGGRR
ncbi:MAG: VWA domain-containing protein [Planctomycetes bacterium]|nr:VWA domain-containing protein [Planctomycetota bacterium]